MDTTSGHERYVVRGAHRGGMMGTVAGLGVELTRLKAERLAAELRQERRRVLAQGLEPQFDDFLVARLEGTNGRNRGPWIQTRSGVAFYPLSPRAEDVRMADVGHALGMICRFQGHTRAFYSVAEHCAVMSGMVPDELALHALLHDAAEAYVCDVSRPLKAVLPALRDIEEGVLARIYEHVGVKLPTKGEWAELAKADLRMLRTECEQVMGRAPLPWDSCEDVEPYVRTLGCWGPETASQVWLERFVELRG